MTHPRTPDIEDTIQQRLLQAAEHLRSGRLDDAERAARKLLDDQPDHGPTLQLLGLIAHRRGDYAAAVDLLEHSIRCDATQAAWHYNLGVSCRCAQRIDDAIACYRRAVEIDPVYASAWHNLGSALHALGESDDAVEALSRCAQLDPRHAAAHRLLGMIWRDRGDIGKSERFLRRAVELSPDDDETRLMLSVVLKESGKPRDALEHARAVRARLPDHVEAIAAEAAALERLGDVDGAWALLRPIVEAGALNINIALVLADLSRKLDTADRAVAMLRALLDERQPGPQNRMFIHFNLGRLLDQLGQYDEAFTHFAEANRLKSASVDLAAQGRFVDRMTERYKPARYAELPCATDTDDRPVFIVGMPRSGTSLVEQVLASHPDVFGAGELPTMLNLCSRAAELPPDNVPIENMAEQYLTVLDRLSRDAKRITDKTPSNFLHLGLIARVLPGARFIHCRRDPLATCWSCFTQHFVGRHEYAYDLETLGRYHRQYRRLMNHWRSLLGERIFDVEYETLVTDPDATMRRLVAFCGLDWSDACARFHESDRLTVTASYDQVTQPIYRTSIDHWRRYEPHLEPLRRALAA